MAKVLRYAGYLFALAAAIWANMPETVRYLVFAMGLDVLTGVLRAFQQKTLTSGYAWSGISKKAATLIIIAMVFYGGQILSVAFAPELVAAVTVFYIYTEVVSILENASILGVPIPDFLRAALLELNPQKQAAASPVLVDPGTVTATSADSISTMSGGG